MLKIVYVDGMTINTYVSKSKFGMPSLPKTLSADRYESEAGKWKIKRERIQDTMHSAAMKRDAGSMLRAQRRRAVGDAQMRSLKPQGV